MLRTAFLGNDDQAAGQMAQPHGRAGLVALLAARPAGPIGVNIALAQQLNVIQAGPGITGHDKSVPSSVSNLGPKLCLGPHGREAPLRRSFEKQSFSKLRSQAELGNELSVQLLVEQRLDVGLWIEYFQIFRLLADADELDRQVELLLDAEDSAPFRGAV